MTEARPTPSRLIALALGFTALSMTTTCSHAQVVALPEAPSSMLAASFASGGDPGASRQKPLPPCDNKRTYPKDAKAAPAKQVEPMAPCRKVSRFDFVIDYGQGGGPLTVEEKGMLAIHDIVEPFNLATIVGYSAISVGINSHSPYGPGLKGWGRLTGYSLLEDTTGEFFGTFAIPALVYEDPRYRRMPDRSIARRVGHAFAHTFVAEHDDGRLMPNYGTLGMYPITAELANLYVPGGQTDGASTARRILVGIATDPVGNLVNEFLPDIAKRVHIHVVFVQEILNQVASGNNGLNSF